MQEEWVHIAEFPGYMISNYGGVQSPTGNILTWSPVQYDVPTVGLRWDGNSRVQRRSVSLLVAKAFLPDPEQEHFNTPIHLDGDRTNCRADNLMWRPLWFAIKFHKEKRETKFPNWARPIILVETGEKFATIHDAASTHGLLEISIFTALLHPEDWVYPYGYHFIFAE